MNNTKCKKGFTLIEVIIVIAIIAILAAVSIPKFGQVKRNASINIDIKNAKTIAETTIRLLAEGKITSESDGINQGMPFKYDLEIGGAEGESKILTEAIHGVVKGKYYKDGLFRVSIRQDSTVIVWIYDSISQGDGAPAVQIYPRPAKGAEIVAGLPNPYALTE